jgi:hypothetical protein
MQQRGGLYPTVDVVVREIPGEELVDPDRPRRV